MLSINFPLELYYGIIHAFSSTFPLRQLHTLLKELRILADEGMAKHKYICRTKVRVTHETA